MKEIVKVFTPKQSGRCPAKVFQDFLKEMLMDTYRLWFTVSQVGEGSRQVRAQSICGHEHPGGSWDCRDKS